jgi:hypothetical protein
MTNPWLRLPSQPPFVLPEDREGAAKHSTNLIPGPWYGPIKTAPVIALLKSPGENPQDYEDIQDPEFRRLSLGQLTGDAPFFWHLPEWGHTAAGQYWGPRLRGLIDATSNAAVAERFAVAQVLPYHAQHWQTPSGPIPSQKYTFELVRDGIDRGALFLAMVGWSKWLAAVPELQTADIVFGRSVQSPYYSRGNLGDKEFHRVVDRLLA